MRSFVAGDRQLVESATTDEEIVDQWMGAPTNR